jgi:hypothetical protein
LTEVDIVNEEEENEEARASSAQADSRSAQEAAGEPRVSKAAGG